MPDQSIPVLRSIAQRDLRDTFDVWVPIERWNAGQCFQAAREARMFGQRWPAYRQAAEQCERDLTVLGFQLLHH